MTRDLLRHALMGGAAGIVLAAPVAVVATIISRQFGWLVLVLAGLALAWIVADRLVGGDRR